VISSAMASTSVALLTGGGDRPYAFGLATSLMSQGITLDLVGSDDLDCPEFQDDPRVTFLNLRGSQEPTATLASKVLRICNYYSRLIRYAATAQPKLFHILWNNKFALFDRTLLTLYYGALGKKIVLTLHNVNAGRRDDNDSFLNRLTLRIQYRLASHIFVHTEKMKLELIEEFGERPARITVIPFGINNAVPHTSLTPDEARQRLGIRKDTKAILFFGNITPYKGLEYLIAAFKQIYGQCEEYKLIIAGRPVRCENYWRAIRHAIGEDMLSGRVLLAADFIPDDEAEVYFKAADVVVLPYRYIYQSGVLFLGYSFGLPVLAADVGSLKEEIVEGKTGFIFKPEDPTDLARAIKSYFASNLFEELSVRREEISRYAAERHSWDTVGTMTVNIYKALLSSERPAGLEASRAARDVQAPS
jgi:D-inositol-3-phosphate glycosyltransferase